MSESKNGAVNDASSGMSPIAMAAKTATKTNCAATNTRFMPASSLMPRMFSPVTSATARMIHSACGVLGK